MPQATSPIATVHTKKSGSKVDFLYIPQYFGIGFALVRPKKHKMKNVLLTLALLVMGLTSYSQSKNFLDVPYLETSARVDTLVTPDKIYLSITIQEKDSRGSICRLLMKYMSL